MTKLESPTLLQLTKKVDRLLGKLAKVDRLQAELRAELAQVKAAIAILNEAARWPKQVPALEDKRGYVDIKQAESDKRWNLWVGYTHLKALEVRGTVYNKKRGDFLPWSQAWFAAKVRDERGRKISLREFERWFSPRSTHPIGGWWDLRIGEMIRREIKRLRDIGYYVGMPPEEIVRLQSLNPATSKA